MTFGLELDQNFHHFWNSPQVPLPFYTTYFMLSIDIHRIKIPINFENHCFSDVLNPEVSNIQSRFNPLYKNKAMNLMSMQICYCL